MKKNLENEQETFFKFLSNVLTELGNKKTEVKKDDDSSSAQENNSQSSSTGDSSNDVLDQINLDKDKQIKELNKAVTLLAQTLNKSLEEITRITNTLTNTINAVNDHASMIEDLYSVQTGILNMLKTSVAAKSASTSLDVTLSDPNKKKTEKPN